jgi:hypothetical protein
LGRGRGRKGRRRRRESPAVAPCSSAPSSSVLPRGAAGGCGLGARDQRPLRPADTRIGGRSSTVTVTLPPTRTVGSCCTYASSGTAQPSLDKGRKKIVARDPTSVFKNSMKKIRVAEFYFSLIFLVNNIYLFY